MKSPLCIISIHMKMNWPFCFYLSTSFEGIFVTEDSQLSWRKLKPIWFDPAGSLSVHFILLKNYSFQLNKLSRLGFFDWEMDLQACIDLCAHVTLTK